MKGLVCRTRGGIDVVEVDELPPLPPPGPEEVVVHVSHVGLNFHDTLVIAGTHVVNPEPPFTPGSEYAGVVAAVGADVTSVVVGDRVAGNEEFGCARAEVLVRADRVTRLPDGVDNQTAATALVAYATAYHALVQRASVRAGQHVAVLGAAGGVGSAAVDVANHLGATVLAGASTAERAAVARDHGASSTFAYGGGVDVKTTIRELTGGVGADVVVDPVGGASTQGAVRAVAWGGHHLVVGFASGEIPSVPLNVPLVKGMSVTGVFFGEFVRRSREEHEANLAVLFDWIRRGSLRPSVHAVLPLDEGREAYRALAAGEAIGKIVLTIEA